MDYVEAGWTRVHDALGGNHFLLTTVVPNIVTDVVYWTVGLLFLYTDLTGRPHWVAKHKVQEDKNVPVDVGRLKSTIKTVLFNMFLVSIPFTLAIYPLNVWAGCSVGPQLPSIYVILRDLAVFVIVEEIGFYYSHRLVHYGPLYRAIHKKHHEWIAPISIVAIYCHPAEMVLSNLAPIVAGPILMGSHVFTHCVWLAVSLTFTMCHHSGYLIGRAHV